jgi:hypothetical protein
MSDDHNVFISHRHEDDALVGELKDLLKRNGLNVRDSSITSETPNNAHAPDYIMSLLRARIEWAGKVLVLVSPDTKNHEWVDREIEYAEFRDKRIVGVWAPGATGCELPEPLESHGDAMVPWDGDLIVRALKGQAIWRCPDGSEMPVRAIRRIGC